ncbi:uncharacterized protein EI90DRAFT_3041759 [Cantharellus anzutake]|uniref:uncharacterized protein n=1 Tax=Cantharellus anzutake TaxID=1750568 RepID=UPI0019075636|nr:uncharacterized protein EI90DRAFT_3041759 [Cantharellus anzutake]KAF8338131.1 hypothetical protein EI90DRAFT_3041759 [Cantharellus anzutake]
MSPILPSPIPTISITLAPTLDDILVEWPSFPFAHSIETDSGVRPRYLLPPPSMSPREALFPKPLPADKEGINRGRFDELLRGAKQRATSKKSVDLRREVNMKVHTSKQDERRRIFLAKIQAPPSVEAMMTPVTPPETPAEFHFALPSPGLTSPLALFDGVHQKMGEFRLEKCRPWVERVDWTKCARKKGGECSACPQDRTEPFRQIKADPPLMTHSDTLMAPTERELLFPSWISSRPLPARNSSLRTPPLCLPLRQHEKAREYRHRVVPGDTRELQGIMNGTFSNVPNPILLPARSSLDSACARTLRTPALAEVEKADKMHGRPRSVYGTEALATVAEGGNRVLLKDYRRLKGDEMMQKLRNRTLIHPEPVMQT